MCVCVCVRVCEVGCTKNEVYLCVYAAPYGAQGVCVCLWVFVGVCGCEVGLHKERGVCMCVSMLHLTEHKVCVFVYVCVCVFVKGGCTESQVSACLCCTLRGTGALRSKKCGCGCRCRCGGRYGGVV